MQHPKAQPEGGAFTNQIQTEWMYYNSFVLWCVSGWKALLACVWHEEQFYTAGNVLWNGAGGLAEKPWISMPLKSCSKKWLRELEKDYETINWLCCVVEKMPKHCIESCIVCLPKIWRQDTWNEALLCAWITGLGNQKTNNIMDHAILSIIIVYSFINDCM